TAIPVSGPAITPGLILTVLAVGIGVTVLTSVLPARDASKVSPIVALTRSDDDAHRELPPWVGPAVAAGVGLVAGGLLGWAMGRSPTAAGIGTGIGAVVGLAAVVVPRILSVVGATCARLFVARSPSSR